MGLPALSLFGVAYALLWAATLAYVLYARTGRRRVGWVATGMTVTTWVLLTIALVGRSLLAGHWPLANRYEFALCLEWAIIAIYLLLEVSWRERGAGVVRSGERGLAKESAPRSKRHRRPAPTAIPARRSFAPARCCRARAHPLASRAGTRRRPPGAG